MSGVLVAGVGNIFRGDDAVGSEVARRLSTVTLPPDVRVVDVGIRALHLAYELLEGYDTLVLVDAAPRGGVPGTVYVIEPDLPARGAAATGPAPTDPAPEAAVLDGHAVDPGAVLALLPGLEKRPRRVFVVGVEPADVSDTLGLSPPVAAALDEAVRTVKDLVTEGAAHG